VEGCVVRAQGHVRSSDYVREDLDLRWRYLRLAAPVANCANEDCERRYDYEPSTWAMRGGARALQCAACLKSGLVSREDLTFCSSRCFVSAWGRHKDRWHQDHLDDGPRQDDDDYEEDSSFSQATKSQRRKHQHHQQHVHHNNNSVEDVVRWETVAEGPEAEYEPTDLDVGRRLRVECYGVVKKKPEPAPGDASEAWRKLSRGYDGEALLGAYDQFQGPKGHTTTEVVLSRPSPNPPRRWFGDDSSKDDDDDGDVTLRVASYNVLAEIYATHQVYPHCPRFALNWPYRARRIVDEIAESDADVVCLQEAQRDHYDRDLVPALDDLGYDGVFSQKTRDAMGAPGKVDGCALFWKRQKVRLAEHRQVQYNDLARAEATALRLSEKLEREFLYRLVKDNVAQLAVFEAYGVREVSYGVHKQIRRRLCVANTHLYSHANFPDTKLWQTLTFVNELERFVHHRPRGERLPYVVCGDFNSSPTSAVYDLLATGQVDPHHDDLHPPVSEPLANKKRIGGGGGGASSSSSSSYEQQQQQQQQQNHHNSNNGHHQQQKNPRSKILPDMRDMTHRLNLASAYHAALGAEPPFTNYTSGFKGTLDYLWFDPNSLRVLAVAQIPSEEDLNLAGGALPNAQYPSDHLMLLADFAFLGHAS